MGPFKLVWHWITTQCSCLSRGRIGLRLKLYIFWDLQEAAIKHTMHQWAVVTSPTTWRTNTFHCFDTRSFLSIKTVRPALKGNQLWLWEVMNTVWPLKSNAFSLSWIISPVFCSVREHTVHFRSLAPPVLHIREWTQIKRCVFCSFSFALELSPLSEKKGDTFSIIAIGNESRDGRYTVREVLWLLNILCCDKERAGNWCVSQQWSLRG